MRGTWLLLRNYAEASNEDRLFGRDGEQALAAYGFDLDRAGAWLLGADARAALAHGPDRAASLGTLGAILDPELDSDGALRLLGQMPPGDRERQLSFLRAFRSGLFDIDPSER